MLFRTKDILHKFGARPFVKVDLKIRSTEMRTSIARFVKDEAGATAIEYAVIAGGISIAIITVVGALGRATVANFTAVMDGFAQ
jgi:pilus assembly protein Flp/PilA